MLDDFLCEIQSDELIPEDWDEELDDFEYNVLKTTKQVKLCPILPKGSSWVVIEYKI